MQAQNDLMALLARKEISIVSTEDEIKIIAKKKLTVNGGGSYITLDGNAIESATLGEYRTRAGYYVRREKSQHKPEMIVFPLIKLDEYIRLIDFKNNITGEPIPFVDYTIKFEDGTINTGVADEKGRALIKTGERPLQFEIVANFVSEDGLSD
jgi:type VI secretion system secreted protein VgrG